MQLSFVVLGKFTGTCGCTCEREEEEEEPRNCPTRPGNLSFLIDRETGAWDNDLLCLQYARGQCPLTTWDSPGAGPWLVVGRASQLVYVTPWVGPKEERAVCLTSLQPGPEQHFHRQTDFLSLGRWAQSSCSLI